MEKSEQKEKKVWGLLLFFLPLFETAVCRAILGAGMTDILHCVLWMALFGGLALLYLLLQGERFKAGQDSMQIIFICVLLALPCALFYERLKPMGAFFLGAVLIAALVDTGAGIVFCFYFCAAALLKTPDDAQSMASLLALGAALCLLAGFLKKAETIFEAVVLGGIVTAILYFLRTSRHGALAEYDMLGLELFSTAAVLLCAAGAIRLYYRLVPEAAERGRAWQQEAESAPAQAAVPAEGKPECRENTAAAGKIPESREDITAAGEIPGQAAEGTQSRSLPDGTGRETDGGSVYAAFLSEDAVLPARMKTEADRLYKSARRLALISGNAAAQVAADAQRCRVISMYHEVGRLADKKTYIPAGAALMREAGLPEDIIADIAGIHTKDAKPQTKEAAIVLLALHIMNTLNYLKLHQGNFTPDRVVDNAFSVLLQKGILDECGLSIREYRQLKKSMLMEFTFQGGAD